MEGQGDQQGARDAFARASELKYDFIRARYNLALLFARMGKKEQAFKLLLEAVQIRHFTNTSSVFVKADGQEDDVWRAMVIVAESLNRQDLADLSRNKDVQALLSKHNMSLSQDAAVQF